MKKIILIISFVLLLTLSITMLTACSGFNFGGLDLSGVVWPFGEDADDEISLIFTGIQKEDFMGKYACQITMDTDGPGPNLPETYKVTYIADKSGETIKEKYTYEKGADVYSAIKIGAQTYYVNEVEGTYSEEPGLESIVVSLAIANALHYGIVEFKDGNDRTRWACQSKTEDVSITNYENVSEKTIQFIYWDTEYASENDFTGVTNEYGEKLTVNFKKILAPVIAKLYYEIVSEASPHVVTKTVTAYPIFFVDYAVLATDFDLPASE